MVHPVMREDPLTFSSSLSTKSKGRLISGTSTTTKLLQNISMWKTEDLPCSILLSLERERKVAVVWCISSGHQKLPLVLLLCTKSSNVRASARVSPSSYCLVEAICFLPGNVKGCHPSKSYAVVAEVLSADPDACMFTIRHNNLFITLLRYRGHLIDCPYRVRDCPCLTFSHTYVSGARTLLVPMDSRRLTKANLNHRALFHRYCFKLGVTIELHC